MESVPEIRIRELNDATVQPKGDFVLYWMTAYRRPGWNFSLERAVEWAIKLDRPLVILEALRCGYQWASERLHRFILDGMVDNARQFETSGGIYYPYVEPYQGAGKGLIAALSERACMIVTDDFPEFFLPRMLTAVSQRLLVRLEAVDSNGLLPLRAADRVFKTAHSFRRFLQKAMPTHLTQLPKADPLKKIELKRAKCLPKAILERWPAASDELLKDKGAVLSALPIDHQVRIVKQRGGLRQAQRALKAFLADRLAQYPEKRNEPEEEGTSGLSPYLHFGHISGHEVFDRLAKRENWHPDLLANRVKGSRSGWWGMSEAAEAFLDELITWRELGFNMCWQRPDYDRYESLPDWAQQTLKKHAKDKRPYLYDLKDFEQARTHDPLWNAAQIQLVMEGRIHNYLRMLWGKKILEWSATPWEALEVMIELNNKYALDGRDPNSYSGIFWVLGRYDRAWGPERSIFGKIRYMSSDNTARKVRVKGYIKKYAYEFL